MIKHFFKPCICLALFAAITACSSDDDATPVITPGPSANVTAITNTASAGTWRITSFVEDGDDETGNFQDYNFTFGNNGVLTATNGTSYTGSWSVIDSNNSTDDNPDSDVDFNIAFGPSSPANFLDLNDDWDVVQVNSTAISLIDVSGGNGGTDMLIFTKNN